MDKLVARLTSAEASISELLELFQAGGILADEDSEPSEPVAEDDGEEPPTAAPTSWPGIAFGTEPQEPEEPGPGDCGRSRDGKVRSRLPYMIRHESNGYCSHNDTATGRCGIYAARPGAGATAAPTTNGSARTSTKIELNEEWIRENLENRGRILVRPTLPIMVINMGIAASS